MPARTRSSASSPNRENSPPKRSEPRPTPSTARPSLSRSSAAVSRASFAGRRRATAVTSGAEPDPLGRRRDRGEGDPGIAGRRHRLVPPQVVPDEEAVPAGLLGGDGEVGRDAEGRRARRRAAPRSRTGS